jgi:hypothetical protein
MDPRDHLRMPRFPPPPRPPTSHPVDVGQRSETAILLRLVELGYDVLVPHGVNHRYDLVLDQGDRFLRVQCKTGRLKNGTIEFNVASIRSNTKQVLARTYAGEVDYFGVYCPAIAAVYMVPCDDTTRRATTLRLDPPMNGQSKRVRWAADYELRPAEPERGLEPLAPALQERCSTN